MTVAVVAIGGLLAGVVATDTPTPPAATSSDFKTIVAVAAITGLFGLLASLGPKLLDSSRRTPKDPPPTLPAVSTSLRVETDVEIARLRQQVTDLRDELDRAYHELQGARTDNARLYGLLRLEP